MSDTKKTIAVLGAGSWGTALALNCARVENQNVYLWGHKKKHIESLIEHGCNQKYLPDYLFPNNLTPCDDISVIAKCDIVLMVVPSSAFSDLLTDMKPYVDNQLIGWAIKGFDGQTNELLSDTFNQHFPHVPRVVLAGPSFAKEVAQGLPTAVTLASESMESADKFAQAIHNKNMRTYTTDDVIGAQIGGALKNVIAIATGIADGLGFGANTRVALITRGLREITRIGLHVGAQSETLMGLSGVGDLVLTASDDLSRNRRFGIYLGKGATVEEALLSVGQTVEGYLTAREAKIYAEKYGVHSPIIDIVASILYDNLSVESAMNTLLTHEPKREVN